ncbi:hypothetical protein MD588_10365 [Photobacterium sp. SDRW27]|uniref:hypothetical protein n=1 Tax=Photobacterium obscurum TaxID=2829490 RepID=UPI00224337EE|nr:hypothetical protein [Photobacterium obscurum]MCW8329210.1 hypothetical protein [Photobacterium obscurum]
MNKLTKAVMAILIGSAIGVFGHGIIPQSFSEQLYSNTSVYMPVAKDKGFLMDLNLGVELREDSGFYMYVAYPKRQLGVSTSGSYEFSGGKLSLYSEKHDRIMPEGNVTLFDHFFTNGETFAKKNMEMLSLKDGVILFLDRSALYLVHDEAHLVNHQQGSLGIKVE